jgi:hypothetical protein
MKIEQVANAIKDGQKYIRSLFEENKDEVFTLDEIVSRTKTTVLEAKEEVRRLIQKGEIYRLNILGTDWYGVSDAISDLQEAIDKIEEVEIKID